MNMRNFGLAAAFMLAATPGVSAQDLPDKGPSSSNKMERAPSSDGSGAIKEKGSMRSEESNKGSQRSEEGPGRSAQDSGSDRGADTKQQKQSDRASGENKKSSSEASKSDQGSQKSAQDNKRQGDKAAESKSDSPRDKSASDRQSDKNQSTSSDRKSDDNKSTADRGNQDKSRDSSTGASSGETGTGTAGKLTEDKKKIDEVKNVQISGERRDRVQSAFKSHGDVKHVTNVDVNISVGSRAPRSWDFVPVPVAVIEVVPEYRGYVFAYVGDNYVICDPDTYEVVALLPASGGGATYAAGGSGGSAKCSTSLSLNEDDREAIIRSVEIRNEVNIGGVSVGWSVPGDVELRSFPSTVVERRNELGACRYFVVDDQIAIVDPDEDKVVVLIEQK